MTYTIIVRQSVYVTYNVEAGTPEEAYAIWDNDPDSLAHLDEWLSGEDFIRMEWLEGAEHREIADEAYLRQEAPDAK